MKNIKKFIGPLEYLFIVLVLIGFFINVNEDPLMHVWFLQTHINMFGFIVVTELVRIVMEKRYAANKNDYIFMAVQLVVISVFLLSVFSTELIWSYR